MKKTLAALLATSMLTSMAFAADYTPGQEIGFDGTEEKIWDVAPNAINADNYSLSTIKWTAGKDLIASVKIDSDAEKLVVTLKHDYTSTKEKALAGSVKLREKGLSKYATLTLDATVGYNVVNLEVDADGNIATPTIEDNSIYKVVGNGKGYGVLNFSAEEADITVRVYDKEVYYLGHSNTPNKNVLVANADSDATINFMNFKGAPTFNSTATVSFFGVEKEGFIYELKDGKLVKSAAKWNDETDTYELKTRTLGSYVISDKALKSPAGNNTNDTTKPDSEKNPDTGANDVVGVAVALAAAALVSAAAVSLKKSK